MPSHDFKDIGDVLDFDILRGTITAIDSATDTCTVSVGGTSLEALIFYHCKPDSILRDNGAIEGAAAGFAVDDEVIVIIKKDQDVVKVIAHVDGIRKCKTLSIYFGGLGTSYGTGDDCWCFIWDIENNDYKIDVPLNRVNEEAPVEFASFPCKMSEISDWLSEQTHPDINGNIFPSSTKGTTAYPALDIDWYGNDSDSVAVPALVGGGINTASGVATLTGSLVITPFVGEEWHNSNTQNSSYHITDAYGQNGTNNKWPMAWSQEYLVPDYFPNSEEPMLFLTSMDSAATNTTSNDGYLGFFDSSNDYSDHVETSNSSAQLEWTSPLGDTFSCSLSGNYSRTQSLGGETISGHSESIPVRLIYAGAPTYLRYRNLTEILGRYTKTLMLYLFIVLFKVRSVDSATNTFTETIYRKVFSGFKKCEDTAEESPLDMQRNNLLEDAIVDVLMRQSAEINMTGIPVNEGQQIADRDWDVVIFGGRND